jgi:hypothetical protein
MPFVLDLVAEPVANKECSAVILVSRMYASIYFHVVNTATFCLHSWKIFVPYVCGFPFMYTWQNMVPKNAKIAALMLSFFLRRVYF